MNTALATVVNGNHFYELFTVFLYSLKKHNPDLDLPFYVYTTWLHSELSLEETTSSLRTLYPNLVFVEADFRTLKEIGKHDPKFLALCAFTLTEYDKVIFLDADLLCLKPIDALLNNNSSIAMVREDKRPCFNSGVVVIGKQYLNQETVEALINFPWDPADFGKDQQIYNKYFEGKITELPKELNTIASEGSRDCDKEVLLHYIFKPNTPHGRERLSAQQRKLWDTYEKEAEMAKTLKKRSRKSTKVERPQERPSPPKSLNLVMGVWCHPDEKMDMLKPFIFSLKDTGYTGHITMFRFEHMMKDKTTKFLRDNGVKVVPVQKIEDQFPKPLAPSITVARNFWYRDNMEKNVEKVLISDVEDVVFQKDLFDYEWETDLSVFLEHITLQENDLNMRWLQRVYGSKADSISSNIISCAGAVIGTREALCAYLDRLCAELQNGGMLPCGFDQGCHNWLLWNNLLPEAKTYNNYTGPVVTLGFVPDSEVEFDKDGELLIPGKDTKAWMYHQYDRKPWSINVRGKYSERK